MTSSFGLVTNLHILFVAYRLRHCYLLKTSRDHDDMASQEDSAPEQQQRRRLNLKPRDENAAKQVQSSSIHSTLFRDP